MSRACLDRRDEYRSKGLQTTEHVVEGARHLRGRYAIVGVGETTYTRGTGMTTRALACWAIRNAIQDAGLTPRDVDGMLAYQLGRFHQLDLRRRRSGHSA